MNGRINELYKQAHIERRQEYFSSVVDPTIKSVSVTRQFDPELFAELIIEDCLDTISNGGEYVNRVKLVEQLKSHFGVE